MSSARSRERDFYDLQAEQLRAADMPPRPLDPFDGFILEALGPLEGLRVLELGCGTGDLTLELLRRGAAVTALDIAPRMVELARERAELFAPGTEARFMAAPVESTGLADASFERVAGKWILHHADMAGAAQEVERVLASGGRAVFFENQDRNPLLRFARRRLMGAPGVERVGTEDEHPLTGADIDVLRSHFERVELSYPNLYFFEAFGRALGHRAIPQLRRLDSALYPALRRYSWHVLVQVFASP